MPKVTLPSLKRMCKILQENIEDLQESKSSGNNWLQQMTHNLQTELRWYVGQLHE